MTDLTKQCLALKKKHRERLAQTLLRSLEGPQLEDIEDRFNFLYGIATEIMGDDILKKTKERNSVTGRRMIAYQMIKDGYSYTKIGRHLKIHYSSVGLANTTMQNAFQFPKMYAEEIFYWNLFQQKIKEKENERN